MSVDPTNTVAELAASQPSAIRVFEHVGIDYCCDGKRTLAAACESAGVSLDEVVRSLEESERSCSADDRGTDWNNQSLTALSEHIVGTHHVFTREELIRLERLFDKVCSKHAGNHPELLRLQKLFLGLKDELLPHMLKEEQVLFPYIERLEKAMHAGRAVQPPFFGTVGNPVRMMINEHEAVGDLLREMREVASNYALPSDACISFQTLYEAVGLFETDLHQHIHLENNILFPRAIETEHGANPEWQTATEPHHCFSS